MIALKCNAILRKLLEYAIVIEVPWQNRPLADILRDWIAIYFREAANRWLWLPILIANHFRVMLKGVREWIDDVSHPIRSLKQKRGEPSRGMRSHVRIDNDALIGTPCGIHKVPLLSERAEHHPVFNTHGRSPSLPEQAFVAAEAIPPSSDEAESPTRSNRRQHHKE
jgi:hypothetical protein